MQTMAPSVHDLRGHQHKILLRTRMLLRIIEADTFEAAYSSASDEDKEIAESLICKADKEALQSWVKAQLMRDYGSYNLRDLRELGRKFCIPYYSRKDKAELLSDIIQYEQSRCSDPGDQTDSRDPFLDP